MGSFSRQQADEEGAAGVAVSAAAVAASAAVTAAGACPALNTAQSKDLTAHDAGQQHGIRPEQSYDAASGVQGQQQQQEEEEDYSNNQPSTNEDRAAAGAIEMQPQTAQQQLQELEQDQLQPEKHSSQELRFLSPISISSSRSLHASSPAREQQQQQQSPAISTEAVLSPFLQPANSSCTVAAASNAGTASYMHRSSDAGIASSNSLGSHSSSKYSGSLDFSSGSPCFHHSTSGKLLGSLSPQISQHKRSPSGTVLLQFGSPRTTQSPKTSIQSPRSSMMSPSQRLLFTDEVELSPPAAVSPLVLGFSAAGFRGSPISPSTSLTYR